jgi:DNA modification methylase
MIANFLNKVFHSDALDLLRALPSESIDAVISDAMYGTAKWLRYEWGVESAKGDPVRHWSYHRPIYDECLRVLKPGGILAWGQGLKFLPHFPTWFGQHRIWSPLWSTHGLNFVPNAWVVQTRERQPVEHPNNMLVRVDRAKLAPLKKLHPCPKPVEELTFMVSSLTKPDEIVLDCFCGLGSTLVAAEALNRNWIGCDRSKTYCQRAMKALAKQRQRLALTCEATCHEGR